MAKTRETNLLTTSQVAEKFKTRKETVRMWIRRGRFPNAFHVGRDWVVPAEDLKGFVKLAVGRPRKGGTSKKRPQK